MNRFVLLCLTLTGWIACAEGEPRDGRIEFSNGGTLSGKVSLGAGAELKLQAGSLIKVVPFAQVQEIRLAPEREEMAQKWKFLEAGQTAKAKEGQPYPVVYFLATVTFDGNQTITGHLYTTVLLIEGAEKTDKVVLYAKQRGQEGESFASVVYPKRVAFDAAGADPAADVSADRMRLALPGLGAPTELCTLSHESLTRLETNRKTPAGDFVLPSAPEAPFFVACRSGARIVVGWPSATNPPLLSLVRTNLPLAEDFFDQRQVLGVYHDAPKGDVYSVVSFVRRGATTLEEKRSQPWRVGLLRWKYDPSSQRLMLAGQNYLFRGILASNEAPPFVTLSEPLWRLRREGERWVAGEK